MHKALCSRSQGPLPIPQQHRGRPRGHPPTTYATSALTAPNSSKPADRQTAATERSGDGRPHAPAHLARQRRVGREDEPNLEQRPRPGDRQRRQRGGPLGREHAERGGGPP
jgi:hypothetical protein